MSEITRRCYVCRRIKPILEFWKKCYRCKPCDKKYSKEFYLKNREIRLEKMRIYYKEYYKKNKTKINEKHKKYRVNYHDENNERHKNYYRYVRKKVINKLGGKCIYCGCTTYEALEINHVNGGGGKERKKYGNTRICMDIYMNRRKTYDLEITCRVCNARHSLGLKGMIGWNITWEKVK